jgi:hypothetical protein
LQQAAVVYVRPIESSVSRLITSSIKLRELMNLTTQSSHSLQPPKRTGFDRPFDTLQVTSWAIMVVDVFLSSFALTPSLPQPVWVRPRQAVFASVYVVSLLGTVACAWVATACDTTDTVVDAYAAAVKVK